MFDPEVTKKDFPIFKQEFNGKPLVYLDNAATTQKPQQVIDAIVDFYTKYNANVSRSAHFLGDLATDAYESARTTIAKFLNAEPEEIIFTKNSTEALNLVALTWGMQNLKEGDVILTTSVEHNSSILPWEAVARATGARVKSLIVDKKGVLRGNWSEEITSSVKVVVVTHVSNVLGCISPIKEICHAADQCGAIVVVDGSQAVSHIDINIKRLGCGFYAFSGHKMLGPTGIGVLWGKKALLQSLRPLNYGGGMVKEVGVELENLLDIPYRFEAGTPHISGAIGLAAAVNYINKLGMGTISHHIDTLTKYAMFNLSNIRDLKILGPEAHEERSGLVSFYIEGIHSHDIAAVLSNEGIAVRSGMHCSMNLYKDLDLPSATRASFYIYNTKADIDLLVAGVRKALRLLS